MSDVDLVAAVSRALNAHKGEPRSRRVHPDNQPLNYSNAGTVRHMAGGDFSYTEKGILPAPSNTVPLRVLAGFGATIQGRR